MVEEAADWSRLLRQKLQGCRWWQQVFHGDTREVWCFTQLRSCRQSSREPWAGEIFSPLSLWLRSFVLYPVQDPTPEPFPAPSQGQQICFYSAAMHLLQGLFPALHPAGSCGKKTASACTVTCLRLPGFLSDLPACPRPARTCPSSSNFPPARLHGRRFPPVLCQRRGVCPPFALHGPVTLQS